MYPLFLSGNTIPLHKRNRSQNIIWYNPPFSENVKSNIGIRLIDNYFPTGHNLLRKIFNRNTLKISYSCMPYVKQIIDGHNKTILKKDSQPPQDQAEKACNCRNTDECPLEGACLTKEVVYQATVKSNT